MGSIEQVNENELAARLEVAKRIAVSAGKVTLKYFQTDQFSVDYKNDGSPLTVADRESETHLRAEIDAAFPQDSILGEEYEEKVGSSGYRWILDPIDGTKSFISGVPLYGTMVAVEHFGDGGSLRTAVIGAVYFPGLGEGIYAARGAGAFCFKDGMNPKVAKVSGKTEIGKSVFLTTSIPGPEDPRLLKKLSNFHKEFYFLRTWGDVYGYYLVATGRAEVMVDASLNIWDAAAVQPIIEEAGGRYSDWNGESRIDTGSAIASNGHLHEQVLAMVSD